MQIEANKKIRILIAEDHETVREGIKLLVLAQPDMIVVGEAGDGEEVVREAVRLKPDIILMDVSMPVMNGLKATRKLQKTSPEVRILIFTRHTEDGYLQQLIAAGASGYVLKQSAPTELINAIRVIGSGRSYLDPSLTTRVMGGYVGRATALKGEGKGDLSGREEEVLKMISLGYSNKEIAGQLQLSVKTIEAHKSNGMRKLGIASRVELVRYAIFQNWLDEN